MTQKFSLKDISEAADKLGIVLEECSPQHAEGTMPVEGNRQPFGVLHGGASALLAEQVASSAAYLWASKDGKNAVGANMTLNHIRSVKTGLVRCIAEAKHLGRRTAVYAFDIVTEDTGQTVCFGTVSCQLVSNPPADQ